MNKIYHLCYTSHKEVLCRTQADYYTLFNSISQAVMNTGSQLMAYAIMSNHVHLAVITDNPSRLIQRIRASYTQIFNDRYLRSGTIGEPGHYSLELFGNQHIIAAVSYISRNPLHHGIRSNPFSYEFSSCHLYFKYDYMLASKDKSKSGKAPDRNTPKLIRRGNKLPKEAIIDCETGQINPQEIVNTALVERLFGTFRSFQFHLFRNDYSKWEKEQQEDGDIAPVNLASIEPFLPKNDISLITGSHYSRHNQNDQRITDLDLCYIIDNKYVKDLNKTSYTELSTKDKETISNELFKQYNVSETQIVRCLKM